MFPHHRLQKRRPPYSIPNLFPSRRPRKGRRRIELQQHDDDDDDDEDEERKKNPYYYHHCYYIQV